MTDLSVIQPIVSAAIGSGAVAFYWYMNNQADPTKPSAQFDPEKLLPAVLTGIGIGVLSVVAGFEPLTEANVAVQMTAYGLITAVIETGLKTVWRRIAGYQPLGASS
jgi:hypothetical protein